jgi:ATP-binding cassette subfamily B protein
MFKYSLVFAGSILYFVDLFFETEVLDYKRFSISQEQSKVMELINGMQEIKSAQCRKQNAGMGNMCKLIILEYR